MWSASSRIVTSMRAEVAVALADQVLEPAGAGDDDVEAAGEGLHLRVLADATEDRGRLHAERAGHRVDDGGDLVGQLAGRHQDQRARPLGLALAGRGGQAGDQREAEGEGLAGAGAAAAEDVPAGQAVGQRRDLDRERRGDAAARSAPRPAGAGTPSAAKVVSVGSTVASAPTGTTTGAGTADGAAWVRAGLCWVDWSPAGRPPRPRPPRERRGRSSPVPAADAGELLGEVIGSSTLECRTTTSASASAGAPARGQGGLTSSARRRTAGRTSVAQPQPDVDSCRSG